MLDPQPEATKCHGLDRPRAKDLEDVDELQRGPRDLALVPLRLDVEAVELVAANAHCQRKLLIIIL